MYRPSPKARLLAVDETAQALRDTGGLPLTLDLDGDPLHELDGVRGLELRRHELASSPDAGVDLDGCREPDLVQPVVHTHDDPLVKVHYPGNS